MSKVAIIDLDGVIANSEARFTKATVNGKINWNIAFTPDLVSLDTLIEGVQAAVAHLLRDHAIVYLTSRPEPMREATAAWLSQHGLLSGARLELKPLSAQYTKTTVWKAGRVVELLQEYQPEQTIIIDDEQRNLDEITTYLGKHPYTFKVHTNLTSIDIEHE